MLRGHPLQGVAAGHFTHAYFPSRLAWLEARSATGRRGELATHFEWAHCDPLQLAAELGAIGGLWGLALAWSLVRTRPRGDPLPPLAAAAVAPFLLLHYPTHLALGMIPITLVLGHMLAAQPGFNQRRRMADRVPRCWWPRIRGCLAAAPMASTSGAWILALFSPWAIRCRARQPPAERQVPSGSRPPAPPGCGASSARPACPQRCARRRAGVPGRRPLATREAGLGPVTLAAQGGAESFSAGLPRQRRWRQLRIPTCAAVEDLIGHGSGPGSGQGSG
jgi:hypothetical protein